MSQDPPARLPGVQAAKPEGQQQPDSSEGSKSQSGEHSDRFGNVEDFQSYQPQMSETEAMRNWREGGIRHREQMLQIKMHNQLIQSLDRQSKAIEEYTKVTQNLTIHIGLLIQAMADGEDDSGDMASVRTLG